MPTQAYFEGQFVPMEQAKVSIMTHAFNYGTAVFEGIRAYWNAEHEQLYVLRLREHYLRLLESAKILRMVLALDADAMSALTLELLRREGYREDVYIRPLAYKSDEIIGVRLHNLHDEFAFFATPFGKYIDKEEGAKVCVSSWRRNDDNAIPPRGKVAGAYVNSALIKSDAQLNGFDEAIVLNQDGHISEGSAENFFMVRGGKLITPPVTANILEGITRSTVIQLARDELGIEAVERPIDRSELYIAEEAFFCGTGVQIAAIASVDHYPVGSGRIGPITSQLRDLYFRVVRGQVEKYRDWCTPVYGA
ncbi:MAG: branched chain amino acid aminotransferase [Chloroflexi bacterium HGW-Chloroflexi-1]|nr:MAG: branched chain amino acid aminotransferase [Chloroflexi bacterium HGW-Chloroflexi-1]